MNDIAKLITGIGLGAGLMYALDPDRGNRRRALARDKCLSAWHKTGDAFGTSSRDIANRTRGIVSEISHLFRREEVSDDVLVERVRSKMGRVVSHASSIEVSARDGLVTLKGPVLADEVASLLKCVSSVRGVSDVDNQLDVHETAGATPGLQGKGHRPGNRFELMQENWSPAGRLMTGVAGGAMAAYGATRMDVPGAILSALGLGLLARAATNVEMKRMVGLGGRERTDEPQQNASATDEGHTQASHLTDTGNSPRIAPEKHETARQRL